MSDPNQTRYFQLDTRTSNFETMTHYVAWRPGTAIVFLINDDGAGTVSTKVLNVLGVQFVEGIRAAVQGNVIDVVGIKELPARPNLGDVDFNQVQDQLSIPMMGTILEVE